MGIFGSISGSEKNRDTHIGLEKRPIKFGQECLNTLMVRNVVGFEEANLNKINNSWTLFWRCQALL